MIRKNTKLMARRNYFDLDEILKYISTILTVLRMAGGWVILAALFVMLLVTADMARDKDTNTNTTV